MTSLEFHSMKAYTSSLRRTVHTLAWAGFLLLIFLGLHAIAPAQETTSKPSVVPNATPDEARKEAWAVLSNAASEKKTETMVFVVSALGDLGGDPRARQMLLEAMDSTDIDVRTAAIVSAGQTKDMTLAPKLRKLLDDPKPQIAFAAACALWNLGDRSGQDLLVAVVQGERKGGAGTINGAMHQANRDMHSPVEIAKMTAPFFLGPFGIGIAAYNYMHRAGGDSPRAIATELIAQQKTAEIRDELLGALDDKDADVRQTAARALGGFHDSSVYPRLLTLFGDSKTSVRIAAAAACIRSLSKTNVPLAPKHKVRG